MWRHRGVDNSFKQRRDNRRSKYKHCYRRRAQIGFVRVIPRDVSMEHISTEFKVVYNGFDQGLDSFMVNKKDDGKWSAACGGRTVVVAKHMMTSCL
ncbi:hypothetical protein ElyMa_003525500 [Elysia marginata]|uniref:Uncharacterized protein n=1 Tax=Elysia marginata TaxID=1093978 RepID=A0AAV4EGT6_9GAST|nr:hypothetical protein ElyMa_003525500 [Elysia marginata]